MMTDDERLQTIELMGVLAEVCDGQDLGVMLTAIANFLFHVVPPEERGSYLATLVTGFRIKEEHDLTGGGIQ
jgi:hypothetical protein